MIKCQKWADRNDVEYPYLLVESVFCYLFFGISSFSKYILISPYIKSELHTVKRERCLTDANTGPAFNSLKHTCYWMLGNYLSLLIVTLILAIFLSFQVSFWTKWKHCALMQSMIHCNTILLYLSFIDWWVIIWWVMYFQSSWKKSGVKSLADTLTDSQDIVMHLYRSTSIKPF